VITAVLLARRERIEDCVRHPEPDRRLDAGRVVEIALRARV
jgi:hypothetical protein